MDARRDERDGRGLDEGRVFGAVDEAGQVEVAVVRPADHLVGEARVAGELDEDRASQVEDDVVGSAGEPDHDVVLRGRHREAVGAGQRVVKAGHCVRRRVRRDGCPQLRPEPRHEVDATDRRPRLAQAADAGDGLGRVGMGKKVELEVGVRGRAQGEDAGLGRGHKVSLASLSVRASRLIAFGTCLEALERIGPHLGEEGP